METTEPVQLNVISLLERLDLRLDEPCRVPGCVHAHPAGTSAQAAERVAA
jgi:hypothetical protein